jgi:hypothetical protein
MCRTFLAQCKGHIRFFEVVLNPCSVSTYPYNKHDWGHKTILRESGF